MERERARPATAGQANGAGPAGSAGSRALKLLALQQAAGNRAVGRLLRSAANTQVAHRGPRSLRSAPSAALQRQIVISPAAYAVGIGVNGGAVGFTIPQLKEYIDMAVKDDLGYAKAYAGDQELTSLDTHLDAVKLAPSMAQRTTALDQLITTINAVHARAQLKPNRETRYATDPKDAGYTHSGQHPRWGDDLTMWREFGKGFGALQGGLSTVAPRGGKPRLDLKVLAWADAKRLLPRPLLNLIFDVRFQLDAAPGPNQPVIDERTATQQQSRNVTPNEPGTLRSWHQDSPQVLPANNMGGVAPAHATALHTHYANTSQSGSGAAIGVGAAGPSGYAEYTGTGSNYEHNTKIVLDYNQKKVYLTLTHYQYWAMLELVSGELEMYPTGTQELALAEGILQARMRDPKQAKVKTAKMMSPWIEVRIP